MHAYLVGRTSQPKLDHLQIEQVIGPASDDQAQARREHIGEGSGVAIQAIQTDEHGRGGQPSLCRIGHDYLYGSSQLVAVIAIAWPPKRSEHLVGVRLEHDSTGAHHFPSFATLISWCAHEIKTAMRGGHRLRLGQSSLTSGALRAIDIDNGP